MATYPTMKDTAGKLSTSTGGQQPLWQSLASKVSSVEGKRVLVLHCGDGWFCRQAINHGAINVLGISDDTFKISGARALASSDRLRYRLMPDDELNRLTGSYDLITGVFALPQDDLAALSEVLSHRLAPQGRLLVAVSTRTADPETSQPLIRRLFTPRLTINALYQVNDPRLQTPGNLYFLLSGLKSR